MVSCWQIGSISSLAWCPWILLGIAAWIACCFVELPYRAAFSVIFASLYNNSTLSKSVAEGCNEATCINETFNLWFAWKALKIAGFLATDLLVALQKTGTTSFSGNINQLHCSRTFEGLSASIIVTQQLGNRVLYLGHFLVPTSMSPFLKDLNQKCYGTFLPSLSRPWSLNKGAF